MVSNLFRIAMQMAQQSWDNREITWELARRDLHKKYKGAALGVLWAAAQPITYVFVYWFAVVVGIRGARSSSSDFPFVLWLIPGMFVWRAISDSFSAAGNSIRNNRELVTKIVFPTITIPQFSVISLYIVHAGLMVFAMALFTVLGYFPTLYWLQLPYFFFCAFLFSVIAATFFSTLTAYSKDLVQFIRTLTQILFWFTPIIWPLTNIKSILGRQLLKLNPIAYLIQGYRWCMIDGKWFWKAPGWTLYFWVSVLVFGCITILIWNRMSRDFADVL